MSKKPKKCYYFWHKLKFKHIFSSYLQVCYFSSRYKSKISRLWRGEGFGLKNIDSDPRIKILFFRNFQKMNPGCPKVSKKLTVLVHLDFQFHNSPNTALTSSLEDFREDFSRVQEISIEHLLFGCLHQNA